ncbi:hypothetical protein ACFQZ4_05020 [Catellatospora coxensis]
MLLHRPERTVVYGPFRPLPRSIMTGECGLTPKPPWFLTNRTAATTGRRLTAFAARPRWSALPGIFASALRGDWACPGAVQGRRRDGPRTLKSTAASPVSADGWVHLAADGLLPC